MEINLNAPIVACHEIAIRAPLESVWKLQTDIAQWPGWNPDISRAELAGPATAGKAFHWETAGLQISSTLSEVVPFKKLAWSGTTGNILGIHVWIFIPEAEGTRVRTEESWEGAGLPPDTAPLQHALDGSLLKWLSYLKARAERAQSAGDQK